MRFIIPILSLAALLAAAASASAADSPQPPELDPQTAIQVEALSRLKGMDLEANPALKAAVQKVVDKTKGTPQFVELVREFKLKGQNDPLLDYALQYPGQSSAADAVRLVLADDGLPLLEKAIAGTNSAAAVKVIGNANEKPLMTLLEQTLAKIEIPQPARKEAVKALARTQDGAHKLLDLAAAEKLPADLTFAATSELHLAPWPAVKERAAKILPLPQGQGEALPPVAELVKRTGDPKKGAEVYRRQEVACINCHQVNGEGTDFGPKLSEIGTKLGKEAIYEAILDPSSGISFGYEAWNLELNDGEEAFGLITSETPDEIALKTQNGIVTKYKKSDIAKKQMMKTSIMPTGLQLTMSTQDLVDLVEYLGTLRKQ